jgi:hypothetical protein
MDKPCIQKLAVERYSAGELAGQAAAKVEEHLRSCPSCGAYLAGLKKEREEFLQAHPFAEFLSAHAAPIRSGPWYKKIPAFLSLPALRPVLVPAVVVLVAVVVIPFIPRHGNENDGSDIRYKGHEALSYIYKRDGAVHTGAPDDVFRPGDRVQIFYSSESDRYVSLFSIDGKGAVSFYQPETNGALCSVRSGAGKRIAYPASIELDSTSGAELVVAVFSDKTFDTNQIKKWASGFYIKKSASGFYMNKSASGFNAKGDMAALEKTVRSNPPAAKSSVLTLILKKGL